VLQRRFIPGNFLEDLTLLRYRCPLNPQKAGTGGPKSWCPGQCAAKAPQGLPVAGHI